MIPGTVSKLSESTLATAATISPLTDLVILTGTTSIATIVPPYGGFSGILILVAAGNTGLLTTGNIAVARTLPASMAVVLVYSKTNNLWYPGAIS